MNGKLVLSFVGGLAVGAAAGFFAAKWILEKQKDEEVQEAWSNARSYAESREKELRTLKEKLRDIQEVAKESSEEEEKRAEGLDIKKIRSDARKAVQSYRRNVFDDPPTKEEVKSIDAESEDEINDLLNDLEDDDIYFEDSPHEDPPLREDPYVISTDEFVANDRNYDQDTLYLYQNGVVVDEAGELVDDFDRKIGTENREDLDRLWDSSGCVLIRNEMEYTDYEVLRMDEDYIPDTES